MLIRLLKSFSTGVNSEYQTILIFTNCSSFYVFKL